MQMNIINTKNMKDVISEFQTQNKSIAFFLSYIRIIFCMINVKNLGFLFLP